MNLFSSDYRFFVWILTLYNAIWPYFWWTKSAEIWLLVCCLLLAVSICMSIYLVDAQIKHSDYFFCFQWLFVWKFLFQLDTSVVGRSILKTKALLTLSWQRTLSYRNQSIDLLCRSMDWFLYDNVLGHESVK